MRKLYYLTNVNNWGEGITNKINTQMKIFKENNFEVEYIMLKRKNNKFLNYIERLTPLLSNNDYKKLNSIKKNSVIYIRHFYFDLGFILSLNKIKSNVDFIILEIPTFPYDKELKGILKILSYKDYIWRHFIYKYIDYVATYSNDKEIYGIQTVNVSNFVTSFEHSVSKNNSDSNELNIIAVASLAYWHGYDRMIKGLYIYYKTSNPKKKIFFHLVGDGRVLKQLKSMVKKYGLDKYVIFYGRKSGKDLERIYEKCDIALDSLGRHRNNIYYNSSLKGKEYMAKGIPIVSGVKTELDNLNLPFYMRVPADETPINVNKISNFYDSLLKLGIDKIRLEEIAYAKKHFNAQVCMQPILDIINEKK